MRLFSRTLATAFLVLFALTFVQTRLVHACASGPVVLNDDTHLYTEGIYFPISDPKAKNPLLIETQWQLFKTCINNGGLDCKNDHIQFEVADSKGNSTHIVRMNMKDEQKFIAEYLVMELSNSVIKHYEGQLHTRSSCGLLEVPTK